MLSSMQVNNEAPSDVSITRMTRRTHNGIRGRERQQHTASNTASPDDTDDEPQLPSKSDQTSRLNKATGWDWGWSSLTRHWQPLSSSSPPRRQLPPQLLTWDQVPSWYAQTDRIRTGFRPVTRSTADCAASLRYLHNESVNIYSHLMPSIVFAVGAVVLLLLNSKVFAASLPQAALQFYRCHVELSSFSPPYHREPTSAPSTPSPAAAAATAATADAFVVALFLCTSAACFGTSAAYHALVCHSRAVAERWVRLDYAAIVLQIWGSFVSGLYMCFYCEPGLRNGYWAMITTLSVATALIVLDARLQSLRWRMLRLGAFVATGLSALAPIAHAVAIFPYAQLDAQAGLRWYYLEGVLILLGAVVYATHFPESSRPVKYDIWGASHQLFHVLVVLGALAHLYGIVGALEWNLGNPRCPSGVVVARGVTG